MADKARLKLERGIEDALERARRAAREQVQVLADQIRFAAPVDTGALQNSVAVEETPEGANILVGEGPVDYAAIVEERQPFVGPAVEQIRDSVREAAQEAISEG